MRDYTTRLQELMTKRLADKGIVVLNNKWVEAKPLGKTIEIDQIYPYYSVVAEYWHSRDKGYRAKKSGGLRKKRYEKDLCKTYYYLSEGFTPLWIDQARWNYRSKRMVEKLTELLERQLINNYVPLIPLRDEKLLEFAYSYILPEFKRFEWSELENSPLKNQLLEEQEKWL